MNLDEFIKQKERFYGKKLSPFTRHLLKSYDEITNNKREPDQEKPNQLAGQELEEDVSKKHKEIAFITEDCGHLTGGRYYVWFMISALLELGHQVTVYSNQSPVFSEAFELYKKPNFKVVAKSAKELDNIDVQADVYFGSPIHGAVAAIKLGKKYNKPVYSLIFDPFPMLHEFLGKRKYTGWEELIKLLRKNRVNILSLCKTTEPYIEQWLGNKNKIRHVYPCVNSKVLDTVIPGKKGNYVMFISRLVRHKNFDHVLRAVAKTNLNLKVIASVNAVKAESVVKQAGMQNRVQFHVRATDREKFEMIYGARAVINGSQFEGFGLYVAEALACGVPFVGYKYPTFEEIERVTMTKNIFLADFLNYKDLANKLKTAVNKKHLSGKDITFSFDNMVKRMGEVV